MYFQKSESVILSPLEHGGHVRKREIEIGLTHFLQGLSLSVQDSLSKWLLSRSIVFPLPNVLP